MLSQNVVDQIGRHWGWVAVRGVVAVLFGLLAMFLPAITFSALVMVWGAFARVDGVLALIAGFSIKEHGKPLWSMVMIGVLGIAAGLVTFFWPGLTALFLLYIIAAWALIAGVFQIAAAIRFRFACARQRWSSCLCFAAELCRKDMQDKPLPEAAPAA